MTAAPAGSWVALPTHLGHHDAHAIDLAACGLEREGFLDLHAGEARSRVTSPAPTSDPRGPVASRLPIGLLLVAVVVIAFVVGVPRLAGGGVAATDPSPSGSVASASVALTPVAPSPSATDGVVSDPPKTPAPSSSASPVPASTSAPSSTVIQQGIAECVRTSAAACAKAIALARKGPEDYLAFATRIVVDDTCPPSAMCDRKYPFDAFVVFVTAGADTTGWYAFHVYGLEYDRPTNAERGGPDLPAHLIARLKAPQPSP